MQRRQSAIRAKLINRRRELRSHATEAELKLWPLLRAVRNQNLRFRRQHSIGPYIADFCCPSKRLVIEIDGPIHDDEDRREYDKKRTEYLITKGYRVIRLQNKEVLNDPNKVLIAILELANSCPSPAQVGEGQS